MRTRMMPLGLAFLLLFIMATGCSSSSHNADMEDYEEMVPFQNSDDASEDFTRVSYENLPQEVKAWVDNSREMNLAQDKVFGERRYILVTYGEQPTGGYSVEIAGIGAKAESIEVNVVFTRPNPDQYVTMAITHPYDIVYIEPSPQSLTFIPTGDEDFIMILEGIDSLQEIVASSPWIKVFSPHPEEETGVEFSVSGVANVYEGTIQYRFLDSEGVIAGEGYITAGMGNWNYFQAELKVPRRIVSGSDYYLEMYTESAKDGSEENNVTVTLKK